VLNGAQEGGASIWTIGGFVGHKSQGRRRVKSRDIGWVRAQESSFLHELRKRGKEVKSRPYSYSKEY
jgi:hypothetical protein